MELVRQTSKTSCGAACYAMIKGISLEQAIEIVGDKWTDVPTLLDLLGFQTTELIRGQPPFKCLAIQFHQGPRPKDGHWTVWNNGKLYDPACIGSKLWPVLGHKVVE